MVVCRVLGAKKQAGEIPVCLVVYDSILAVEDVDAVILAAQIGEGDIEGQSFDAAIIMVECFYQIIYIGK